MRAQCQLLFSLPPLLFLITEYHACHTISLALSPISSNVPLMRPCFPDPHVCFISTDIAIKSYYISKDLHLYFIIHSLLLHYCYYYIIIIIIIVLSLVLLLFIITHYCFIIAIKSYYISKDLHLYFIIHSLLLHYCYYCYYHYYYSLVLIIASLLR